MRKDDYQKLRKGLQIDKMDKASKDKLLKKFSNAGGKIDFSVFDKKKSYMDMILGEKSKRLEEKLQRLKNKQETDTKKDVRKRKRKKSSLYGYKYEYINKKLHLQKQYLDKYFTKDSKEEKDSNQIKLEENARQLQEKAKIPEVYTVSPSLLDILLFVTNGLLLQVCTLNYKKFHYDFIINFFPRFSNTISRLGYFLKSCFNSPQIKAQLRKALEKISIAHYDILLQFINLFDEQYLNQLYEYTFTSLSTILPESEVNKFGYFFKKLFLVATNIEKLEISLLTARNVYSSFYPATVKEKDLLDDINFLFTIAFDKFALLFCINVGKYISQQYKYKEFMKFTDEDVLGYYYNKEKNEEEALNRKIIDFEKDKSDALKEDIEKKEIAKIPDEVKKGFNLMDEIWERTMRNEAVVAEEDHIFSILDNADKILVLYVFYKEYLEQYTIFFTLQEVKYNTKFDEHKKVDVKEELNNVLNDLNVIYKEFEKYAEIVHALDITDESSMFEGKIVSLKDNRAMLSNSIRQKMILYIKTFINIIIKVIKDYKDNEHYLIGNPDEAVFVDEKLHSKKYLNKKSIIYIFTRAFYFLKALLWRLEKTDLSGPQIQI